MGEELILDTKIVATIEDLKKEINLLVKANKDLTKEEKANTSSKEQNLAKISLLNKQIKENVKELVSAAMANRDLNKSFDAVAEKANNVKTAFNVAAASLKAYTELGKQSLSTRFPGSEKLSRSESKVLTTSYSQAQMIGDNKLDMATLAAKAFKGNMVEVNKAVAFYNELMEKNSGVDAITLNTTALIALRQQITATSGSVSALNKELSATASMNVADGFEKADLSIKKLETDINGVKKAMYELDGSVASEKNLFYAIQKAGLASSILNEQLLNTNKHLDAIKNGMSGSINGEIFDSKTLQPFTTSINGMRVQLTSLQMAFESLSETDRNGAIGQQTIKNIQHLQTELEKTSAITQRATKTGWNPMTNSIQQLARELPNFAISAQIGFMAISNNLPILADAITQFKATNKAAVEAGGKGQSIWKGIGSGLFSLGGAFTAVSAILMIFGPQIGKFFEELFEGEKAIKKVTNAELDLLTVNENLHKSMKSGGVYLDAISNIEKLKIQLEKSTGSVALQKKAVDDYNSTLGTTFGEVTNVSDALKKINDNADDYIAAMKNMAFANQFFEQSAKDAVKQMEVSLASNADVVNEKTKKYYIEEITKVDKIVTSTKKRLKELIAGGSTEQEIKVQTNLVKEYEDKQKKLRTEYNQEAKKERERQIAEIAKNQKISLKMAEKYYDDYGTIAKKKGWGAGGKKTKEEKDNYTPDKIYDDPKVIVAEAIAREVIKWEKWTSSEKTNVQIEQQKIDQRMSKKGSFFGYGWQQFTDNANLAKAALKDLDKNLEVLNKRKAGLEGNEDAFNLLGKEIENAKIAGDDLNKNIVDQKNAREVLGIELEKAEDIYKNSKAGKETTDNAAIVKSIKDKIAVIDENITSNENLLKQTEDSIKLKQEEQKNLKQGSEEYKKVTQEIIDLESQSDYIKSTLHKNEVERWKEKIALAQDYLSSFASVASAGADIASANMDQINADFDRQQWIEEEKVQSAEAREQGLYQLDLKRWEALQKDFEKQKEYKKALAWINFAQGSVGIWTAPGITALAPFGFIAAGIQQAALLATTLANVKSIDSQQMLKPHAPGAGGAGGAGGGSNISLNPAQNALTSNQENLNTMNKSNFKNAPTSVVKVSEINDVQDRVKVREENASY